MSQDKVLVANGQGFWGDSILGPIRLVNEGPLDYLTLDYLAEVTMSIMQKLKSRDPSRIRHRLCRMFDACCRNAAKKESRSSPTRAASIPWRAAKHWPNHPKAWSDGH